jgi:signal peptidase I
MKKIKSIQKKLYWVVLSFLAVVAVIIAISAFNIPNDYKILSVLSGSMEPTIKTGSIVVVKPEKDYKKDDIITFIDPDKPRYSVTHRINKIQKVKGEIIYSTKGDANKTSDTNNIRINDIKGKVLISIPLLGYAVNFAKSQTGLLVLIIIPAVIIVYNELMNIKKEAIRLLKERRKRKLSVIEKVEEKIGEEVNAIEKEIKKEIK